MNQSMSREDQVVCALKDGKPVLRPPQLEQWELNIARKMWGYGHGTRAIARRLWTKEFRIYNNLSAIRDIENGRVE